MFNRLLSYGLGLALSLVAVGGRAEVETNAPAATLALQWVGEPNETLLGFARDWARENLALRVKELPTRDAIEGSTLEQEAEATAKALPADVVGAVVLLDRAGSGEPHGILLPSHRVALVNVAAMRGDAPDAETLRRRLDRQTLRAFARLMDLTNCPNPQCSLCFYGELRELDAMGRNFCPPCLRQFQDKARERHVELDADSPFYMFR